MGKFTDRIDASMKISLYEYGIIRNPETNKCIICTNTYDLDRELYIKPKISVEYITLDDVIEALNRMEDGYFSFIDSTKENELKFLDNIYLTRHIFSIERYCGYFEIVR